MATVYPGALDTFTNPTENDNLDTTGVKHHEQHADINDAVEALEAKVGINSSGVTTSLDYRVTRLETYVYEFALSDEVTAITTGTAKLTWRAPHAMTITALRASLSTESSSGIPTVDINESGTTILSTKLTIDAGERTSTTAATAYVISDASIADDAEITFDIDVAGTGAKGLKVKIYYTRP
jgi:hypothetical protein